MLDKTRESGRGLSLSRADGRRQGRATGLPRPQFPHVTYKTVGSLSFLLLRSPAERGALWAGPAWEWAVPPQSPGPGQKFCPLQHQDNQLLTRPLLSFFPFFSILGHFISTERFFYFLFYILLLLFLIITVRHENTLSIKASSTTERQAPLDSLPWETPLLHVFGGVISLDSNVCAWRSHCTFSSFQFY